MPGCMAHGSNQVVIVTGGAQGIGRGICEHLLGLGHWVVVADIDVQAGRECVDRWKACADRVLFMETDVSDELSVMGCVAEAVRKFGRIDALVNNAGIADPGRTPVEDLSLEQWDRFLGTNLTGCFLMAKHAIPHLRRSGGSIVNIASTRALQSEPNTEAYSASKGGIVALTHSLAISLGPQIRVNCISPGWIDVSAHKKSTAQAGPALRPIDHEQHPVGRVGLPGDIAAMVAFLICDWSGFVTGQNFVVDGGMTRKMIYVE
jgi:NAD(P)-dependent dehydrogenase (short-subunit alcohol dehydrogenase family)